MNPPANLAGAGPRYHLEFTEEMKGHFAFDEPDPAVGEALGRASGSTIMFHLTISTDDVDRFVADPQEEGVAVGWVASDPLGGQLPVERGIFNLFVTEGPGLKRMHYRLFFADSVGHPLTLRGHKEVNGGAFTQVWAETTTLYTSILRGHVGVEDDATAEVVGAGIIHIRPLDFAKQLTTFRVSGPELRGRLRAFALFSRLFADQLWQVFRPGASR